MCVYKIEEITERIRPIAEHYGVGKVYLFGSYARGEATETSDVDLLVDAEKVRGLKFFGLYEDLKEALEKKVDLITEEQLSQNRNNPLYQRFIEEVELNRRVIYNDNAG